MKATYQHSWLWFSIAILMVQLTYGQETILVANFVNGNNAALNSRIYLFNGSNQPGDITVRVFTLPVSGGIRQELTPDPLNLGSLGGKEAFNIKLDVDILIPLGIPVPYTSNGGNLTLEFTIQAADVVGVAQVFSSELAFGTYPMQEIGVTSSSSGGDDHGNTCGSATSVSVNSAINGSIETAGDNDYFQVQVPSTGTLTVYTSGSTDTFGELRHTDCSVVASNDDSDLFSEFPNFRISQSVSSGTYYVAVRHFSNSDTGSYTLNVEFAP